MRLEDVDLRRLLPQFMRDDPTSIALCEALTPLLRDLAAKAPRALLLPRLDELPEDILDILAAELLIYWYTPDAPAEVKRALIRTAYDVHAHMGTPHAVESVLRSIFTNGKVEEWWQYGGEPYHFRTTAIIQAEEAQSLPALRPTIETVKNARSWLDTLDVLVLLAGGVKLYAELRAAVMRPIYRCGVHFCGTVPERISL